MFKIEKAAFSYFNHCFLSILFYLCKIKVPWKTCVVPRTSYDSSYYCCLDCNYFLSNYLTIAALFRGYFVALLP